jgi:hypothetical protein
MRRKLQKAALVLFVIITGIFGFGQLQQVSQMRQTIDSSESSDVFSVNFSNEHAVAPDGCAFQENRNYPPQLSETPQEQPWRRDNINFKQEPVRYLKELLTYGRNGNQILPNGCLTSESSKWFHMPMTRENANGLTEERPSEPGELHPDQTRKHRNWAVSVYNKTGGYTIGQVWGNSPGTKPPVLTNSLFREGAMVIKFLFTEAKQNEVPYLKDSPSIIRRNSNGTTVEVRLLQIDVAVRDSRLSNPTGWVFGTFIYNGERTPAQGQIIPIGLMYGNGVPTNTNPLSETIYNPQAATELPRDYEKIRGEGGRLNGPVDNPRSSCLSCHANADVPKLNARRFPRIPPNRNPETLKFYFRNIGAGRPFAGPPFGDPTKYFPMDYSLQFQIGIMSYNREKNNILKMFDINNVAPAPFGRDGSPMEDF